MSTIFNNWFYLFLIFIFIIFAFLERGIKLVVVAIGDDISSGDIDKIAPPSSGGNTGVIEIDSTNDLDGIIPTLAQTIDDVSG